MATSRRSNQHRTGNMPPPTESAQNSGPSCSMPEPPPNWPPQSANTNSSEAHLSSGSDEDDEDEDVHEERREDSNSDTDGSTRTRGPTLMHNGWGKDGTRLEIKLNRNGQPICGSASVLASNLGVIARNGLMAPLDHLDWRKVPKPYKYNIWKHVKENTNATDDQKHYIMRSIGKKWKEWKATAKRQGYTSYKTIEERLANRPLRVEESQWRTLVYYWDQEDSKRRSAKNKENRAQSTMLHTAGRNSNAQVRENMTIDNGGVEPSRMEVFEKTHNKKDGSGPSTEAAAKAIDKMKELKEQNPDLIETGISRNDIYGQVMGPEKHGYVRTVGLGPTPTTVFGPSNTILCDSTQDMRAEMGGDIERVRGELSNQMHEREAKLLAEIESMKAKEIATQTDIDALKARDVARQLEIDALKAKDCATQAEFRDMRGKLDDLIAQIRSSGSSNASLLDVSSAARQVSRDLTAYVTQDLETPQMNKNKQAQLISRKQLFNFREDRSTKKSKKVDI